MTTDLLLTDITLDPATQVRVADHNEQVVTDYAAAMQEGDAFPPIVVFRDPETGVLRMSDGRNRYAAYQRLGRTTIAAEVREGTQADAVWYAALANRTHGHRMTKADRSACVARVLLAWPHKVQAEIARHVGCSSSLVSKIQRRITSNTGGVPELRGRAFLFQQKRTQVRALLDAGLTSTQIRQQTRIHTTVIAEVKREGAVARGQAVFGSRRAIEGRITKIRAMADEGYTTRQIAATVHLGRSRIRHIAKTHGIDISADRVVGLTHHHDSNRIVSRLVMDAEHLTAGAELIKYDDLNAAQIPEWIASLKQAREQLSTFIRRLMQEQSHEAQSVSA